jgi:dTDP-4-dehydrorhamnose reductase
VRVLLIGATGLLGKVLLEEWDGDTLTGVGSRDVDIRNPSQLSSLFERCRPEWTVLAAAYTDVDGCEKDPERAFAVNGAGAGNIARACEAVGGRMFHISTDYVFDGRKTAPYEEDDETGPIDLYGRSKLEGERQVLSNGSAGHVVIRTSWLYGIHRPNFVEMVLSAAQTRDHLEFVIDQVSCPTWTAHLSQKLAELMNTQATGILHLAGTGQCSRYEFACQIVSTLPKTVTVSATTWAKLNRPAARPVYCAMVSRRLASFGIVPLADWKAALNEYLCLRKMK